jgi:AcrR family transcriptional regulator
MRSTSPLQQFGEGRHFRILTAALEVFSKRSFGEATTDEIAHRAHVSKRDIYAAFPDKHALLIAVIVMALQTEDETFSRVIADSRQNTMPLRDRLELIGLALINEILSPVTGFVSRLVSSESIQLPPIGVIYFEKWYARRSRQVALILSKHLTLTKGKAGRRNDAHEAAKHYLALITHLPQLTAAVGKREMWTPKSVQTHVGSAVDCFIKAYPALG